MKKQPHPNPVALWVYGSLFALTAIIAVACIFFAVSLNILSITGNSPLEEGQGWLLGFYPVFSVLFSLYTMLTLAKFKEVKAIQPDNL